MKRADALKHVRPVVISNISVASRMGQVATGCNLSVAETEKLPVHALSYEAVLCIRATKHSDTSAKEDSSFRDHIR